MTLSRGPVSARSSVANCRSKLAAMSRIVTPRMAAEVSNLGGLGMLAMAAAGPPPPGGTVVAEVQALTKRPVGAGFLVLFLDREALEEVAAQLPIVEFFWGWPDASLVPAGCICGWQVGGSVTNRRRRRCRLPLRDRPGCRGQQAVTYGARRRAMNWWAPSGPPSTCRSSRAAGSERRATSGRRSRRAPMLVRVGTRFVATVESDAHDLYVDRLVANHAADTVITGRFDVGWPDRARPRAGGAARRRRASAGRNRRHDLGRRRIGDRDPTILHDGPPRGRRREISTMYPLYAGTGIDAVTRRSTVAEVMAELALGVAGSDRSQT